MNNQLMIKCRYSDERNCFFPNSHCEHCLLYLEIEFCLFNSCQIYNKAAYQESTWFDFILNNI